KQPEPGPVHLFELLRRRAREALDLDAKAAIEVLRAGEAERRAREPLRQRVVRAVGAPELLRLLVDADPDERALEEEEVARPLRVAGRRVAQDAPRGAQLPRLEPEARDAARSRPVRAVGELHRGEHAR